MLANTARHLERSPVDDPSSRVAANALAQAEKERIQLAPGGVKSASRTIG